MIKINIKSLKIKANKELKLVQDLKELNEIYKKYLGKNSEITNILRSLGNLPETQRKETGKLANEVKKELDLIITKKREKFEVLIQQTKKGFRDEWIDITIPGKKHLIGHLHPLSLVKRRVEEIFQTIGFSVIEGPEIENEWYHFDALNIPKDHPARDAWDTFWLKLKKQRLLLRAHTSPVQIRYMEKNQPPYKIIAPGRVYRHEATDSSHEFDFWQIEGLMVDRNITVANFKGVIDEFLKTFFNIDIKSRLRPGFFPFTEPSFELDIFCFSCNGKGCSICKGTGWIEMIPGGMVHPNVLKAVGLNPKNWQGFAFGAGMSRLAMMNYKINDIRLFNSGDLRFLEQF